VDEFATDATRERLADILLVLHDDPRVSLLALREFRSNPNAFPPDAPLHELTNRSSDVCRGYYFDDSTETAIQQDAEIRRIRNRKSDDQSGEQGLLLRSRRLEIYLKRRVLHTMLGRASVADNEQIAA
jgi:hypothetical protein